MINSFEPRLAEWQKLLSGLRPTKRRVAVLVSPWLQSAVPLFSLECALAMARDGMDVTVFWDDSHIFQGDAKDSEREAMEALLAKVSALIPVCAVATLEPATKQDWSALALKVLQDNAIARAKGEDAATDFLNQRPELPGKAEDHLNRVQAALEQYRPDWVFVPGGVYATSAMYREVATHMGIPCGTYDSDEGLLFVTTDGVATHHADIPRAVSLLKAWLAQHPEAQEFIQEKTQSEIDARVAGSDSWGFQLSAAKGAATIPCHVLVPLNLRWDTAALSRQRVYPTVRAWMESIIRWSKQHPEVHVCFRQHPCERFTYARGSDDMGEWIKSASAGAPNIHFIAADDQVSTYDLLKTTRVLLPHTSTIALEAAMQNIPTVLGTRCYYEGFGFAWSAQTEEEFHQLIDEALASRLTISPEAGENARLLYFLTQLCAPMRVPLTPTPKDFAVWITEPPSALWEDERLADLRRAFRDGLPTSYLSAVRLCENKRKGIPA